MMRIGWIQTEPVYGEVAENLAAVRAAVQRTAADLWVLPELFSTGYLFGDRAELERLAEPLDGGPTVRGLAEIAGSCGTVLVGGLPERGTDGRIYNAAVAVDRAGVRAHYRKIHLFDREKEWFDPGDLPFSVVPLAGARVGMMVCFDWRFPEATRALALLGAQVVVHPSNLVQPHCQAAMVTRALENRLFIATTNRIGTEERGGFRLSFTGASQIVGPDGRILSRGPDDRPAAEVVAIDPSEADDKRATPRNDLLADRRPEFYL